MKNRTCIPAATKEWTRRQSLAGNRKEDGELRTSGFDVTNDIIFIIDSMWKS